MPYAVNDDLPPSVKNHLPPHAQDIYREAFNHAWLQHRGEATPHRIAWAAVKRSYQKVGDTWIRHDELPENRA
jgi:cation transport regulator